VGQRRADSGQYLLAFEGDPARGSLSVIERNVAPPAPAGASAQEWFERGVALENEDGAAAIKAYERAFGVDPARTDARINLGRLLHETGQLDKAERVYREAIKSGSRDSLLHYNFGVLLHDQGRKAEAFEAYRAALRADPGLADCHYNLALLCEQLKRPKEAIRHMSEYRRLVGNERD
jgi:tetratricopeptide (TPR) repeat protein